MKIKHAHTGEIVPAHLIGQTEDGRPLYQGVSGYEPTEAADFDADGNFSPLAAGRKAGTCADTEASITLSGYTYRAEVQPGHPMYRGSPRVSIYQDRVWAGDGRWSSGEIVDCAAVLGDRDPAEQDAIYSAISEALVQAGALTDDVAYGLTFPEWMEAARSQQDPSVLREAWRAGEDPAEYRK